MKPIDTKILGTLAERVRTAQNDQAAAREAMVAADDAHRAAKATTKRWSDILATYVGSDTLRDPFLGNELDPDTLELIPHPPVPDVVVDMEPPTPEPPPKESGVPESVAEVPRDPNDPGPGEFADPALREAARR